MGEESQPVSVSLNLEGPWDFTEGPTEGEVVRRYIGVKNSPDAVDFPEANVAMKIDTGITSTTQFYKNDKSASQILGISVKTLLSDVPGIAKANPPVINFKYPFKVGDSWESVNDEQVSGLVTGNQRYESQTIVVTRNSIKVPQGSHEVCYLLQSKQHRIEYDGSDYTQIRYTWVVPGVGLVASIDSIKGEQNEVFTQASEFKRLKYKGIHEPGL